MSDDPRQPRSTPPAVPTPAVPTPAVLSYVQRDGPRWRMPVWVVVPYLAVAASLLSFPAGVALTEAARAMSFSHTLSERIGFMFFAACGGLGCGLGAVTWARLLRPGTSEERRALRLARVAVILGAVASFFALLIIFIGNIR